MEREGNKWRLGVPNPALTEAASFSIRGMVCRLMDEADEESGKPMIMLGHGDPSKSPCYRTSLIAEEAIASAVRSAQFNGYAPTSGVPPARW